MRRILLVVMVVMVTLAAGALAGCRVFDQGRVSSVPAPSAPERL